MILKQSRDGKTVATYETEELAVKANHLSLALLRSHLNSKKPKYLDGFVYVAQQADAAPPPVVDEITFPAQTVSANLGSASTVPPEGLFSQLSIVTQEGSELKFAGKKIGDVAPSDKLSDTLAGMPRLSEQAIRELAESALAVPSGPGPKAYDTDPMSVYVADEINFEQLSTTVDGITPLVVEAAPPMDPEPSPPGEEQGFDLRTIAKQRLSPDDTDLPPVETDFNLTPMQKRAKELKKRPPL